jgi:predicted nuclease of predicted toxin-antitoxin system
MRGYLLDENLPDHLLTIATQPIHHVREFGQGLSDSALWEMAKREQWVIVSKDADFAERIMVEAPPPWIIHIKLGNLRLSEFRAFIVHVWPQVEALLPNHKLISIYHNAIEAIAD